MFSHVRQFSQLSYLIQKYCVTKNNWKEMKIFMKIWWKCNKILFLIFHIFTTSSYSKIFSIFSNSSSKSTYVLINYTKLKKDLKPTLGSLGQFFLTNIFFKFFYCKLAPLEISNYSKAINKIFSISNYDLTMLKTWTRKLTIRNINSWFPLLKKTLDVFHIHSVLFEDHFFLLTSYFASSFVLVIISKISKLQSSLPS